MWLNRAVGAPVSRIVLRAGEGTRALAALDPAADQRRHALGIVAEGAGLHDRVLGKHVEVGDRREDPVDAHRAGLLRRDRSGPSGHRGVAQRGERERRRELGESLDLLPRAALEVRGEQQRTLGAPGQIRGEPADALDVPAEDDEAADAELQRVGDRGGLVAEAAVGPGAERGDDEPAGLEIAGHQAGVTEPSTREPRRAGRGGHVAGLSVQREVAEQREGDRFLRVAGEEQLVEAAQRMFPREPVEAAGQRGHESGMVTATAATPRLRRRPAPSGPPRPRRVRAVSSTAVATPSAPGTRAWSSRA